MHEQLGANIFCRAYKRARTLLGRRVASIGADRADTGVSPRALWTLDSRTAKIRDLDPKRLIKQNIFGFKIAMGKC